MSSGKSFSSPKVLKYLSYLGQALDDQQQLHVFDRGLVMLGNEAEGKSKYDEYAYPGERSPPRPRSRQRTPSEQRRSSGKADYFGSEAHEKAFGAEFRILARHYDALAFEDKDGLWVAISSMPLGLAGPQADFLIGVIFDRRVSPRAWAFSKLGSRAKPMPLKHTNLPDASVCAMTKEDDAWSHSEGLVALIDHFTIWAVKSWHRQMLGWWPGPQFGFGSYYRKREFVAKEWCGCGSGKRYGNCHQASDLLESEEVGRAEFKRAYLCEYEDRAVPEFIMDAARSKWRKLPSLASVFSQRPIVMGEL